MQQPKMHTIRIESVALGVVRLVFGNPPTNSMSIVLLEELAIAIENLGEQEEVQIIILQSEGERTFCSGADFNELMAINDRYAGKIFFTGFAKVINACRKSPKIILGCIQGKAIGGGVGLAATVDYCLATKFAAIKLSELTIGIIPAVIEPAVERKIGLSSFATLALNATDFFSANWAKEKGLFMEVFETVDEMDKAIIELATRLASYNPAALTALKKIFWKNTDHWDTLLEERAEISGKLVLSSFTKETLQTFTQQH
ncbi:MULTISPECIES: enoyl-CoA hydratase/isomerase family protein [unclassified Arcicella]|uniref:enoyl-CoA hydratase/isomerase family protein n=1 Tax=unclassified Arcicella TaxID=2644986 RepID=UPI002865CB07|nr:MULTISPECIES: enoyl-CoA hydratase/isomerase family protein [unclassified Arcicella]MDR6563689.1 methylglutaconyl-CoA hydratase [Arcicella sp. BE51]MDR6814173.1 methylglutaconyl-CoA hydratase [Arcicella sp. BE140]MDR6825588.1 methylglutaconyl-CoA hydratase [Arcicella sp. BE139]